MSAGPAVACTVKSPIALQIGDTKTDTARPGVYIIDVTLPFGKSVDIEELCFKNFYTAFLTVCLQRRGPGEQEGPAQWVTCLRDHPLMASPHTEEGSQDYYSIHRLQMLEEPDKVVLLRLILRQPSSAWMSFTLEEIRIVPHVKEDPENEAPDWLSDLTDVDQQSAVEGLPDSQTVSSSILQMWALTEVMQTNQTTTSIGRFDVDGCYDINLLSFS